MKFALVPFALALPATVAGMALPQNESDQPILTTCCYELVERGFQHKFTSNRLVNTWALGTGNWCLAQILRDAEDPDNCAAAETKTRGGYCEQDVPLTPITC